ncbi:MAG: DUF1553 domain-containing protein [Fuerstiella sp.]
MKRPAPACCLVVLAVAVACDSAPAEFPGLGEKGQLLKIVFEAPHVTALQGRNARRQLQVTGHYSSGQQHDLSSAVKYRVTDKRILTVDAEGLVTPLADGSTDVTAIGPDGRTAKLVLTVTEFDQDLPVSFRNEIVPIFTKLGCNSGGCHGKADGQNGFRLSLLGFYPHDDYEYLVYEDRGRRIFPADPDFSLLLQKPTNQLPHGGGRRISPESYEWQLIRRWIAQGTPYGSDDDPTLEKIEAVPPAREMNFESSQQLAVLAHYSDGSVRDVTRLAAYEANLPEMAAISSTGRVTVAKTPGEVAVMVRFQGAVSVFRGVIPQGIEVRDTPPERSFVDQHVFARLKQLGIPPSPVCDDATFIRRVTVDIAGRLPTAEETKHFLTDTYPARRNRLIDQLINSPAYADYFANKWSSVLRNRRRNGNDIPYTYAFHAWIRSALQQNMPYDHFVRSVLTATGDVNSHPPVAWYREVRTSTERMEDTAQLFLGMRLACAKCHHHPFERWSQQDYYGFEAFFSQVDMKSSKYNPQTNIRDAVFVKAVLPKSRNPRTEQDVLPQGLGGEPLEIPAWQDARHALVDWMAAPDNPYFARALVNRYWKHFFGRGIVDPEDDLRMTNPPVNPELLDALARHFIDSRYDLKDLVRLICRSSTYQLSSDATEFNRADTQNFSSFYPRRLSAELLYDAISQVTETESTFNGIPRGTTAVQLPDNGFNNYFLQVFGKPEAESACECERSVEVNLSQSLHLLNSGDVQNRIRSGSGRAVRLARDQDTSDADKIRELYLAGFSREPAADEVQFIQQRLTEYDNVQQAWEDVIWAIVNAKEFQFVR